MRPLTLPLSVLLALALPGAGVGWAAPDPPGAPQREVVLALTLAPGAPRPAAVTAAADRANALGLRVVASTDTLLRVAGPPAVIDRLFPAASPPGGSGGAPVRALGLPQQLRDLVTVAVDPADPRPYLQRRDTAAHPTTARELTAAYGVSPLPPLTPALTPRTPTVGSLQLSDWDPADLTRYAQSVLGRTDDPVASGQYSPVVVQAPGQREDAAEVALDQEAILGAAPHLRQRPYFTTNSAAGVLAALDRALADVRGGVPLVAFSISYGVCELAGGGTSLLVAQDQRLAALVAAGVTVTAASGDAGRYDCGDIIPDGRLIPGSPGAGGDDAVDFPASSPAVLALGGTRHENGPGAPLPDMAWDDGVLDADDAVSPAAAVGSGGGSSAVFGRPAYQSGLAPLGGAATGRLLPDVALDADPQTGAVTIIDGRTRLVGGTSLSAPLAAAHVADLVADRTPACAAPVGLGDLHDELYGSPSTSTDVVERKQRTRGPGQPATHDPATGFDLATGLGTPAWSRLDAVIPRAAPAACESAAAMSGGSGADAGAGAGAGGVPALTMRASATFVQLGARVTLTGRVTRGGAPVAGTQVVITERYVDQPDRTYALGQATTGADGSWSLTFRPLYVGTLRAAALGAQVEVPSRVQVTYRRAVAAVDAAARTVTVDAETRPGFRIGPSRGERVQLLEVDARGRQTAVLAGTQARQRTFPRNEAQGTNGIRFARVRLAPGQHRLVVKVLGTPANTGARSRVLTVRVP